TGLTNGTTYYYQVVATDGVTTATSNEVQARPVLQGSSIYAHYDASNIASVTVANINEVTAWADISGKASPAVPFNADVGGPTPGTVLYPDATQSTLGLDLLDLGETRNMLRTIKPGDQDALLDFNGAAAVNSGFSFFVVARVDALLDGIIRDVVLANTGGSTALALKFQGGSPELILGGVTAEDTIDAVAGDTLVLAANYDAATGTLEFWNSKAGASVSVTVPAGDFSTAAAIFIGGSPNGDQYMDGAIGEVKFYQGKMTAAEFTAEQNLLVDKWLTPAPIQGSTLYAHYDASQGENVTAVTNNEVTALADNSGNAFNATADGNGSAIQYPSASASSYGVTGLDVPATADSKLLTFTSAQQDEWLDFSRGGAAQAYSGFTIFAVVKPDAVGVTTDVVFSNHGNSGTTESLSLRYTAGKPTIWLGGEENNRSAVVAAGETVVLAVKYDSVAGELRFWDSESRTTGQNNDVAAADFSSVQNMYIAGSLNNSQGMDGLFGELKVYRGAMTDQEFEDERNALMAKWVQNAPVDVTAGADASDITLAWADPNPTVSDTYSVYRSEVSGTYTTALASGLASTNYTDTTGVLGTIYYYVVTATRDGNESGFSAEVAEGIFAAPVVYAHYDASDVANVTLENTNEVTDWLDISGNVPPYDADVGSLTPVLYPDATQSATGLNLLDMGETSNRLRTLLPAEQDALLDFDGAAAGNSGFSFFVVTRVDALIGGTTVRDVILANRGNINGGLHLRFNGGSPKLYLGGGDVAEDTSAVPVAGDTLVIAANYNKVTGVLEFWNSKANASVTVTVTAADFSEATAIFIGGSNDPNQYMDGAIGEVKFYQGRMSPAAFAAEQLALTEKWITGSPVTDFTSWVDGTFANGTLSDKTATGDDDNDGISNLIEFAVEGQDPTVSNSTVGTYSGLTVTFLKRQEDPAVGGITYAIEQSTDLGVTDTWAEVTAKTDTLTEISYEMPGTEAKDFVRLKVTQE
ncbi:LamG domain-containing protein, partial [Puniceicoccaceae bacterium]|nr:LamG domain-containing protein [Puniceicoccaceae bacterium]